MIRYNTKTTEYASGFPGKSIATYMLAKYNIEEKTTNPKRAMEYYERVKEDDRKEYGEIYE